MSRIKLAALALLFLLGIPLGLLFFRPEYVLGALLNSSANEFGYRIEAMRVSRLSLRETALESLSLSSSEQRLDFSNMVVRYSLGGLAAGEIESLEVELIELAVIPSGQSAVGEEEETLSSMLTSIDAIPIDAIDLAQIRIDYADYGMQAELSLQSPPLRTQGNVIVKDVPDTVFAFTLNRADADELIVSAVADFRDERAFESDIILRVAGENTSVSATSSISLYSLRESLTQYLPASTVVFNDSLLLRSDFEILNLFGEPAVSSLSATLDSPGSVLHLAQESDLGRSEMQLRLPITIQGDIASDPGDLRLSLSEMYATGSWTVDAE